MKKILWAFIIVSCIAVISCSKDSIKTKPTITLKSFKPNIVEIGGNAIVTLGYTDKEADIDSIYIIKNRINVRKTTTIGDTLYYKVPEVDKNQEGDIELNLLYSKHLQSALTPPSQGTGKESDSLIFKFYVKDQAKNLSDTVVSSLIVVKRN